MSAFLAGGCLLLLWARNLEGQARGPLVAAIAVWAAAAFLYAVVPSDVVAAYFFRVRMSAVAFVTSLVLLQALRYSGWEQWTRGPTALLLFVVPTITVFQIWTAQHWVYEITEARVIDGIRIPADFRWGPWFFVHAAYGYSAMLFGIALYMGFLSESMKRYRSQTMLWGFALGLTLLSSAVSTFGSDFLELRWDFTAASFAISAPAVYWIIITYEASDLRLVARQALLDEITSAVAVVGDRRQIIDSNPAYQRLSELVATKLLATLCGEFRLPSPRESPSSWEVSVDVAGDTRHFDVHATSLGDGRGRTEGWLILAHDVTERALLIEELESYDRIVAHDLRNPLVGGVSLLDLADLRAGRGGLPPEIGQARQAFTRALDIIKAHLRLARLRTGQDLIAQPLDMGEIVESVLEQLGWQISQTGAQIRIPETWPSAVGDAALIGQVWSNYISNAIRHGSRPPRIGIGGELLDHDIARFWVENEDRPTEAKDYKPAARAPEDGAGGLGMGLTIVRRIVERSGGTLGSSPADHGRGVKYWFTLPARGRGTRGQAAR
jgi:signal transduction histidine kinase